jgi:hypothetical protein
VATLRLEKCERRREVDRPNRRRRARHAARQRVRLRRGNRALRATLRPGITKNEVWGTSNRVFGSPHLPVPFHKQSAEDEPIEPFAPREVMVATAWIIAWALTVFIVADVIVSI